MLKPYAFQKEGILKMEQFLKRHGGTLLADDMGLGKTLQTLWLLIRERAGPMFPALVVAPASVKYGWEHAAHEIGRGAQVLEGRKPSHGARLLQPPPITIINPDILPYWADTLRNTGFRTIILDECHMFGNPSSQRTRAAFDVAGAAKYRIALSGTPLMNTPAELWPTLFMLRPDKYPSLFSFAEDYCYPRFEYGRWKFKGAKNLPELHSELTAACMVRRRKEDVLHDLPAKNRVMVPMELRHADEYHAARTDFRAWLQRHFRDNQGKIKKAMRAQAVTRVGYLLRLAARCKVRSVVDWANRFLKETGEKLVIFGVHKKMIGSLHKHIKEKSVVVDGGVAGRSRKLAVDQFRHDSSTRIFIGNMRACGVGVDGLQDVCTNAAFAEMWWVPGIHAQAEDRIYRIGQKGVAWIHYLIAPGTIEERLLKIVREKQTTVTSVLDGANCQDVDVFDELLAALEANDAGG